MATDDQTTRPSRIGMFRRESDRVMVTQFQRYRNTLHVGQVITSEIDKKILLEVIIHQTNEVMGSERSTVFIYDKKTDELWSEVGVGVKKKEIRIPSGYGVAGWVFKNRSPVIVNDAYNDPRFYAAVDKKSGFRTNNIICIPLVNWGGTCIGALQSLNKSSGDFDEEDKEVLFSISNYVTIALENMRLFEELKSLNDARERAIHHLSHELKTPLALIASIFDRFPEKLQAQNDSQLTKRIKRGQRNVQRLIDLQEKIDDILNSRYREEKEGIARIILSAASFVEDAEDGSPGNMASFISHILKRIESAYHVDEIRPEQVVLDAFMNRICKEAVPLMEDRDLEITRQLEKGLSVTMDSKVLQKVFCGLLRNAIENTPDEGKIDIRILDKKNEVCVVFQDYGIGITPPNQRLIFGGFFHTQDTMMYSSKKPYKFNAGGSGSDLLRIKTLSDRYGFAVGFESTRCCFIPNDTDECAGRISACPFVAAKSDCFASGGSLFYVTFSKEKTQEAV